MEYNLLNRISSPDDVKNLSDAELNVLCDEVRHCLIHTVSKNGGHLASNLGVVELTVAIHKSFSSPKDKIIFDVGHQCYTHKLLTGRFDEFSTIRKQGGLSGFMRPDESIHDPFVTGHSSNSVSAAYGIQKGLSISRDGKDYVVAVVGDGAMTGGLIYEGLNNAGSGSGPSLIVVLNDNKMSISRNVGALAKYLSIMRSRPGYHRFKHYVERAIAYIPLIGKKINRNLLKSKTALKNAIYHSNIFEDMGFHYLGPVDGHDLNRLNQIFKIAKDQTRPVLVHVLTKKGKGYKPAEIEPNSYHGVSAFDIENGASGIRKTDFSANAGDELCQIATRDKRLCVITAAMTDGTGLLDFSKRFSDRFFDVGIAEEHATTFASGLSAGGAHPVFCVYSSFLQRAYDQLIHDVAISGNSVTLCVDRAGLVGEDGETHQGVFDIAFLKTVPGIEIFAPSDYFELRRMLSASVEKSNGPSAVRYPRGIQPNLPKDYLYSGEEYSFYGSPNAKSVIITFGRCFAAACECYSRLKAEGKELAVLKLNRLYPIENQLYSELKRFDNILIFEEGIRSGGINETLCAGFVANKISANVNVTAIEDEFIPHMSMEAALNKYGLDADSMYQTVCEVLNGR